MHILAICLATIGGFFFVSGAVIVWSLLRISSLGARYEERTADTFFEPPPSASAPVCGIGGNSHQRRIIRRSRTRGKELASA